MNKSTLTILQILHYYTEITLIILLFGINNYNNFLTILVSTVDAAETLKKNSTISILNNYAMGRIMDSFCSFELVLEK